MSANRLSATFAPPAWVLTITAAWIAVIFCVGWGAAALRRALRHIRMGRRFTKSLALREIGVADALHLPRRIFGGVTERGYTCPTVDLRNRLD